MRHCSQHWLDRRCREAGKQNGECDGCIVERGEVLTVDETHADFPLTVPSAGPGLLQKAANFAASAAAHVAAGMPRASEEEVARRFEVCQGCEHYDGRACTKCGCPIVREKQFVSKLSWANEKCPVGKWGPVDTPAKVAVERSDHAEKTTDGSSGEAGSSV